MSISSPVKTPQNHDILVESLDDHESLRTSSQLFIPPSIAIVMPSSPTKDSIFSLSTLSSSLTSNLTDILEVKPSRHKRHKHLLKDHPPYSLEFTQLLNQGFLDERYDDDHHNIREATSESLQERRLAKRSVSSKNQVQSSLSFTASSLEDCHAIITCSASNSVGRQAKPCLFTIIPEGELYLLNSL